MSAEGDDDAWLYGDEDDKGMNLHFTLSHSCYVVNFIHYSNIIILIL